MKREEIEELIAEYITGEIRAERLEQLKQLFKSNPAIKQEAEEMLAAWQSLGNAARDFEPATDDKFYTMLNDAKQKIRPRIKVFRLNWLANVAASAALMILAFLWGRSLSQAKTTVVTKTVIVKQAAPPAQIITKTVYVKQTDVRSQLSPNNKNAPHPDIKQSQQLRSVYASDRLAAITNIARKQQLSKADIDQLTLVLKEDPSPNVRLATVDLLRPMIKQPNVQAALVNALNDQDNSTVQASIVDILLENHSTQAMPQLINLLHEKNTTAMLQEKIKAGIENFIN